MKQISVVKKILTIDDIDLRRHVRSEAVTGQVRYTPSNNRDGLCYGITEEGNFIYPARPTGTVVSMWNRRGGQTNGLVYTISSCTIFYNSFPAAKGFRELYGEETYYSIKTPTFYDKVVFVKNGVPTKSILLVQDINNPENIIVWREINFALSRPSKRRGRINVVPDGKFLELDGDQSIKEMGVYKKGFKNKKWLTKKDITEGVNKLTELVMETDGKVLTSLLRGVKVINAPKFNEYFIEGSGKLYTKFKKNVVGKIHGGEIV
jgi:hypothetical protein